MRALKSGVLMSLSAPLTWCWLEKTLPVTPTWTISCPAPGTERWNITTSTAEAVPHCDVVLVTVPTPITHDLKPDLSYVEAAGSGSLRSQFQKGSNTIVVLESTVYPGVTAQTWLPIIEELGLVIGEDLEIAYCPERFNPGDAAHGVRSVARVIGCSNPDVGEALVALYQKLTTKTSVMSANSKWPRLQRSSKTSNGTSTSLL